MPPLYAASRLSSSSVRLTAAATRATSPGTAARVNFLQRGHVGQKAAAGVAVVQALLLRHIAEHAAERNAVRGAAAPQHLA